MVVQNENNRLQEELGTRRWFSMKKKFSVKWKSSKQPRKQRKFRYNAPLHIRQKMVAAHLDKLLRKEYKKRSTPVRKGDEIVVMRGNFKNKKGNVTRVDLKKMKIYIDAIKVKKPSGQEVEKAIDPSNVKITRLNLDDRERIKVLKRKNR
jgi:large subunit ribosomal protein L24